MSRELECPGCGSSTTRWCVCTTPWNPNHQIRLAHGQPPRKAVSGPSALAPGARDRFTPLFQSNPPGRSVS